MENLPNSSINGSSTDSIIRLCHVVEVHVTGNTMGSVISDTICCFVNLFMAAISICSNALVIRVYAKLSSGKTSANLLLVSLSTLEMIKSGLVQPAFFIWKVMEIARLDYCYPYLFTIIGNNFCTLTSFLHTCFLISAERYLSVFRPILHRKPIVRQSFKVATISTNIVCAAFLLSMFFTSYHQTYFMVMYLLILTCLPATAIMYFMIRAKMRKSPMQNAKNITAHAASKQAADRRMNKTVITIILVSLACYLPLFIVLVFLSVHERTVWHTRFVIPWVYLVTFATAALNPFLFCWKNRRLRNEMIKFTSRVFTSNPRTLEHSTVSSAPISHTTKV